MAAGMGGWLLWVAPPPPLSPTRLKASNRRASTWKSWRFTAACVLLSLSLASFTGLLLTSRAHGSRSAHQELVANAKEAAYENLPRRILIEEDLPGAGDGSLSYNAYETGDKVDDIARSSVDTGIKTLSFKVCNGFANQRLALLNGMVLAKELNRAVVLPRFIVNGRQDDPSQTNYGADRGAPMSSFYNDSQFIETMKGLGVAVASEAAPGNVAHIPEEATEGALRQQWNQSHVIFGCPLLRLGPDTILRNEEFVMSTLAAIVPNDTISGLAGAAIAKLKRLSKTGSFNFLHLRLESDWLTHCGKWKFGQDSDNCFTNTLTIDEHLKIKRLDVDTPLYVSFDWESIPKPLMVHVFQRLEDAGYQLVTKQAVLPSASLELPRELSALLEYTIAMSAAKFVGNSVSTFSALLILDRERRGMWSSYYNMGDIPLAAFMPLYQMPWVFTYNGHSPNVDYMLKAAVKSSKPARLTPFCIYNGTNKDPMFKWLQSNGVKTIIHEPAWLPEMQRVFPTATSNAGWSPLYKSYDALFGTFQRIDIPIVPELEQYNYVLFTDADIVFERVISLQSFQQPLPQSVSMAFELDDIYPCNAGVMLMNLPFLRESYNDFIEFVFATPGLFYGKYGPGDQGAINQFYGEYMEWKCTLSESFNAKPHKNGDIADPFIVHFHGPKPKEYLRWKETGNCSFGNLCSKGFDMACRVMQRHEAYLPHCDQ